MGSTATCGHERRLDRKHDRKPVARSRGLDSAERYRPATLIGARLTVAGIMQRCSQWRLLNLDPHALIVSGDPAVRRRWVHRAESQGFQSWDVGDLHHIRALPRTCRPELVILDEASLDGSLSDALAALPRRRRPALLIIAESRTDELIEQLGETRATIIARADEQRDGADAIRQARRTLRRRRRKRSTSPDFEFLVGNHQSMRTLYEMIAKVAPTDATVLLCGESGTGKELVARSIHARSECHEGSFVPLNCGAIPESLIESELFGHERGAFTGADRMRKGVFERARGGTLLLDEITEMPSEMQVRLLRVLEDRTVTRVGGENPIAVDVRVIAATNRDPQQAVKDHVLREDLLYRLSVFPTTLPPLRDRGDDVRLLANHFLAQLNTRHGTDKLLSSVAVQRMRAYRWPGNVRQLMNIVHRAFILESDTLDMTVLEPLLSGEGSGPDPCGTAKQTAAALTADTRDSDTRETGSPPQPTIKITVGTSMEEAQRELIVSTLNQCDGNKSETARQLGISVRTLYNRLRQYEKKAGEDE